MKKIIYSAIFLLSFLLTSIIQASEPVTVPIPSSYGDGNYSGNFTFWLEDIGSWRTEDDIEKNGIMFSPEVYNVDLKRNGTNDNSDFIISGNYGSKKLMPKNKFDKDKEYKIEAAVYLALSETSIENGQLVTTYITPPHTVDATFIIPKTEDTDGPFVVLNEIKKNNKTIVKEQDDGSYLVENNEYTVHNVTEDKLTEILDINKIVKSCIDTEDGQDHINTAYASPTNPAEYIAEAQTGKEYQIKYYCKDSAGNAGSATLVFKKGRDLDIEPPVIEVLGANPLEIKVGNTVRDPGVTCFDEYDNEYKKVKTKFISGNAGSATTIYELSKQQHSVGDEFTLRYSCSDDKGLKTTKTREIEFVEDADYTIPVISWDNEKVTNGVSIETQKGDTFSCSTYAKCTDYDNSGNQVSGETLGCEVSNPRSQNIQNFTDTLGWKTVKFTCIDNSGNEAKPKYLKVNVVPQGNYSALTLSSTVILSGSPKDSIVGKLKGWGSSGGNTGMKITLGNFEVKGDGDNEDYEKFKITGDEDSGFYLVTKEKLNYSNPQDENKDSVYNITIVLKDNGGQEVKSKDFKIHVLPEDMVINSDHNKRCKGWAWSSNVGWLSLNCTNTASCAYGIDDGAVNYGMDFDASGDLTGYAWSPNIGWLDMGDGGGKIDLSTGEFSGESYFVNKTDTGAGTWEGGIKYSGSNYSVKRDSTSKRLESCAWGGTAVGWMCFSKPNTGGYFGSTPAKCANMKILFTSEDNSMGDNGLTYETRIEENDQGKRVAKLHIEASGVKSCETTGGTDQWKSVDLSKHQAGATVNTEHDGDIEIDDLVKSTEFGVKCTDSSDDIEERHLFIMVKPPKPQKVKFTVDKTSVPLHDKVTLNWEMNHVAECKAEGGRDSGWQQHKNLGNPEGNNNTISGEFKTKQLGEQGKYDFKIYCRSAYPDDHGYEFNLMGKVSVEVADLFVKIHPEKNPVSFNHPIKLEMESRFAQKCTGRILSPDKDNAENYDEISDFNRNEFTEEPNWWYNRSGASISTEPSAPPVPGRSGEVDYVNFQTFESDPITVEGDYVFEYKCTPMDMINQSISRSDQVTIRVRKVPVYIEV